MAARNFSHFSKHPFGFRFLSLCFQLTLLAFGSPMFSAYPVLLVPLCFLSLVSLSMAVWGYLEIRVVSVYSYFKIFHF